MKTSIEDWAYFGGGKVFDKFRTTMNLAVPDEKLFYENMRQTFEAGQFSNNGPNLKRLEEELAAFHQVKHCIAFCNCFTGMYMALRHLGLPGKNEVVMPSLTYRRMSDIVRWAGYLPRFCDVDEKNLAISPRTAEKHINENTALMLAPHPITNLCDIDGMEELSARTGVPLFFDSVEACGASHNGKPVGGFGKAESFSLHASKVLNASEGGYITTNDPEFANILRMSRAFGFSGVDTISCLGANAKMNEMHAALALSCLAKYDGQMEENKRLHLAYQENFKDVPGVSIIDYNREERRNWKSLLLRLEDSWPLTRTETLALLNAENIHARPYYAPPQHQQCPEQAGRANLPVTEKLAQNHMILPFGSTVSLNDAYVISRIFKDMRDQAAELQGKMR